MNSLLKSGALATQRLFLGFDKKASELSSGMEIGDRQQPIFIIGAPRTGSTLLSQAMLSQLRLGYISNLMAICPKQMVSIARRTVSKMERYRDIRESKFGFVPGLFAPSEAGAVLRLWFGSELDPTKQGLVKNTLGLLSQIFNAPCLIKNLNNTLRLAQICAIFPKARFIHLRRSPLFAAQSLLLARRSEARDERRWFGPKPPGYERVLAEAPCYQVLWQVLEMDRIVSRDLVDADVVEVSYEQLCATPETAIGDLAQSFSLEFKESRSKLSLKGQDRIMLSSQDWGSLESCYQKLISEGLGKERDLAISN